MRQLISVVHCLALLLLSSGSAFSQVKDMTFEERTQLDSALEQISKDVIKHYYDPKLHGVDWDAKVKQTRDKIKDEKSLNMGIAHVAALLDSLNDSHTFLLPPPRPYILDHGWAVQMIGDKCYVIRVRPGGDAETHGVKPGDQLISSTGTGSVATICGGSNTPSTSFVHNQS
jgi:predicted metalloprotease with PDZ domain